jgi:nucleolar pre-ribosomal-associated protein 1
MIPLLTWTTQPASVNRHLQNIVQSPQFFRTCAASATHDGLHPKDAIVELLLTLFNLHPYNTCQPSHVEPLVYIYGGTLSAADCQLLSIFQLFENHRKTSVASIFSRWSSSSDATSSTPLEALQSLDSIRVLRTCLAYPNGRYFTERAGYKKGPSDELIYDPVFVMLLFGHMCSHSPPESALDWVELFRTNVVSLLIRTLSSKDDDIRKIALCQIAALWKCLEVRRCVF